MSDQSFPKKTNPFHFKQFTIQQDRCAMKVGTDGALLGAWANVDEVNSVLDIGTGTGLLALMIAQRAPQAAIHAIEINEAAFFQARDNFQASPWKDRLTISHESLQAFITKKALPKFDLILCNPPYFDHASPAKTTARTNARHSDSLPLETLIRSIKKLLLPNGNACLVLPYDKEIELTKELEKQALHYQEICNIKSKKNKPYKRILTSFGPTKIETIIKTELIIHEDQTNDYSDDFVRLLKEFYLYLG